MKHFGVFRVTATYKAHHEALLYQIWLNEHKHEFKSMNSVRNLTTSRDDQFLKDYIQSWKMADKESRKTSRCTLYSNKYIIHECDENGVYLPSKKELKECMEMAELNHWEF